ncbi:hypothetical protein QBC37DRAFT_289314 [Rhypophila decipiens]|uniref:RRM domain-containing protein n=1 Tax=Rhypophila decipiens TaxID=261697 RepID=A0AAN6Y9G0_9PEZI|nr:hypothetical protein QBC37DRAFT_289314 [Rhypophila decipiens]
MARFGPGPLQPPTAQEQALRQMTGMSPNYHGDVHNVFNHSLNDLPDEENCSFWLSKLPPDVEIHEITDQIRSSCGRVYHIRIISGDVHYRGAAAIVTFFNSSAAMTFFDRHVLGTQGCLRIRGKRVCAVRNRTKIPPQLDLPMDHTRVIRIAGPVEIVNYSFLTTHFESFCKYELEDVLDHSTTPGHCDLEFRFARYDSQAECVFHALERDTLFIHNPLVTVHFAVDPCA